MARDPMPPMVVSANRYLDIEPYGNRLRASNPIKWGSIFPWEFPQSASRLQEEDFLRKWFSVEEVHVQGGAGDESTPGPGFKFLKQVWYSQAIWNWEHRVPAVNDYWWKNTESAGLISDPSMQKYFLNPNVELKTFFHSKELEQYGEKFLSHVIPMIQQTARARIEEKVNAEKKAVNGQIVWTVANVPEIISASEAPTAALGEKANLSDLVKVSSQPADGKSKMILPIEAQRTAPYSAVPDFARPRGVSDNQPALTSARKRGYSGSMRYPHRGGQVQPRQPFHHHEQQLPPPMHGYQSASGMQYEPYPQFSPGGPPDFVPRGRGQPSFVDGPPPFDGAYRFPTIDSNRHRSTFASPFEGQQPNVIWATTPLLDRSNLANAKHDPYRDNGPGPRGGYGQGFQDRRGRVFSADRGRGRGGRGGRNSFGSHGQISAHNRWTSYEFKGSVPTAKARRASGVSNETNWRSGSDHPQKDPQTRENTMPLGRNPQNIPPRENKPFHAPPYRPGTFAGPPPPAGYHVLEPPALPDDPRYHCTQYSIGDLCPYVTKVTTFTPQEISDNDAAQFFQQFGTVMNFHRLQPNPLRHEQGNPTFVTFATADEARHCMNNKPETWPSINRPLRIEVSREYWDPTHARHWSNRVISANMMPVADPSNPSTYGPMQRTETTHRSHDSSSTIRAPLPITDTSVVPEPQDGSRETTPTASGTNTPKKKSKAANKKNKNKQNKDLCTASRADDSEETGGLQSKLGESSTTQATQGQGHPPTGLVEEHAMTDKPNLTVDVEKQRSASKSTERQTTSEPSMTPVDKVTAKLPKPESGATMDKTDTRLPGVADLLSEETSAETSAEPPITPADSATVNLPSDAGLSQQPFREHKAEKEAPSTDMISKVEGQSVKTLGPSDGSAVSATKLEDEPIDDSFHTATGSPASGKALSEGDAANSISTEAASCTEVTHAADEAQAVRAEEIQKNDTESVEMPHDTPSMTINTELGTGGQTGEAKRSASGATTLLPPAAFVTAPNTPAVGQATDNAAPAEDSEPPQPKKPEKAKGPSKTESLSMFGKKQKKSKTEKKKGTLKGKPKDCDSASTALSEPLEPMSATSKPTIKAQDEEATAPISESLEDASALPVPSAESKGSTAGMTIDIVADPQAATPQTVEGVISSTEKGSGKRKGGRSIFDNIRGLFTGSQTQSNPQDQRSTEGVTTTTKLTDVKAPKNNPKRKTPTVKPAADADIEADHVMEGASKPEANSTDMATSKDTANVDTNLKLSASDLLESDGRGNDLLDLGLGIACSDVASDGTQAKTKKKKARAKNKGMKKVDDNTTPNDASVSREVEQHSSTNQPFRKIFTSGPDTPTFPASAPSDTSSNTMGEATPSTGTSSPIATKQPRKLPLNGSASGNVLQGKEPSWKNKKRAYRVVSGLEDSSADEESKNNYALETVDSKNSANGETLALNAVDTATTGMQIPRTVLRLSIPPGTRWLLLQTSSNDERAGQSPTKNDNGERDSKNIENEIVKQSKAKMKRLIEEESSRKHGQKGSKTEVATKVTEGEKSRIEELRWLLRELDASEITKEATDGEEVTAMLQRKNGMGAAGERRRWQ